MVSVVSPKGGVGKTTVATNLAVGLAQRVPNSTVLVDLDVQFGDVASALDLEPEHFLADAVHATAKRDSMVLKTFLTQHRSGLYVICAPARPPRRTRSVPTTSAICCACWLPSSGTSSWTLRQACQTPPWPRWTRPATWSC